jgi:hypothetical protein
VAIKDTLRREVDDTSRAMHDNISRGEGIADARQRSLDVLRSITTDLDDDDRQAVQAADEGVKRDAGADFDQSVETVEQQAEAKAGETQARTAEEMGKVRDGQSRLEQAGGASDYGASAISAARERLRASEQAYEDFRQTSERETSQARQAINAIKSRMQS